MKKTHTSSRGPLLALGTIGLLGIVASSAVATAATPTRYGTTQECQEAGGTLVLGPGPAHKTWCRQKSALGASEYFLVGTPNASETQASPADLAAERRALESAETATNATNATNAGPRKTSLSPREQLVEAQRRLERVRGHSTVIRKNLQRARRSRDLVVTACLNDKLTQINVAARAADERATALREAVARNDTTALGREYTALSVVVQRAEDIDAEARQCVGMDLVKDTAVKITIDPKTAPEDAKYPSVR